MGVRLWLIGALLAAAGTASAAPATLSAAQRGILLALVKNDLSTYLEGGKSFYKTDWESMVVPWTEDKDIGMRYARGAIAADAFFGKKDIFIRGRYISADNWIDDSYRVQMWALAAIVDKANAAFLSDAHNGSTIEMACHAQGQELQTAYVSECISADEAIENLTVAEVTNIEVNPSPQHIGMLKLARWADSKIAPNDPCRRDESGCADQVGKLLSGPAGSGL